MAGELSARAISEENIMHMMAHGSDAREKIHGK